jgi:meromycolic acid enoyl-[acyl-carrier-protein] reductase
MPMLEGKKLLITGVVNRESIAYEVARQAQEAGAEVVLT